MKNKINCIIIDNRDDDIKLLETEIRKVSELELIHTFKNPFEGKEYLEENAVDLLFLDISMRGLNGTELLRMLDEPPVTILCTAHPQFQSDVFELDVADCLLKPFRFDRFLKAIRNAKNKLFVEDQAPDTDVLEDYIFVKTEYKTFKMLHVCDINYIMAADNHVDISLVKDELSDDENADDHQLLKVNEGIGILYKRLSKKRFFRSHRSYVVALDRIDKVLTDGFLILNIPKGKRISISEKNMAKLFDLLGGKP